MIKRFLDPVTAVQPKTYDTVARYIAAGCGAFIIGWAAHSWSAPLLCFFAA